MQFLFFWPKKYFAFENWESLIQHHHFRRPFLTNSGDATLPTPVTSLPLTERVNVHLNFFFFFLFMILDRFVSVTETKDVRSHHFTSILFHYAFILRIPNVLFLWIARFKFTFNFEGFSSPEFIAVACTT